VATKLQKNEIISTLRKYGRITSVKNKWWDVILVPYLDRYRIKRKFRASRKVEYLALKEVERDIRSALLWEVRLIEAKRSEPVV